MIQLDPDLFGALMFCLGMSMAYALAWIVEKLGRECE
jgi:hypothetical protein